MGRRANRSAAGGATAISVAAFLASSSAEAAGSAPLGQLWNFSPRLESQEAVGFAVFMGLVIFSTTTAILYIRERRRWVERERALTAELSDLQGASDRAELLLGSDRQVIVTWPGRGSQAHVDGDPSIAGPDGGAGRVLAFGSWLAAQDATTLESAVTKLRGRGDGFALNLRRQDGSFVEAVGRTAAGRALLRIRDITGAREDLLRAEQDMTRIKEESQALRGLFDAIPEPAWLRGTDGRLRWANRAYCQAVEAANADDVRNRSLELLDRTGREEAERRRKIGESFRSRVAAIVAGARRVLDVTETPAPGGSGGIAVDVSELESVRADLQRQMQAHVRTLDQLPTAVAMFDANQKLVFHNAAYRQLWSLDQAFLDTRPSDSEILDRLRANRKLPEQADFRSWKSGVLAAYRAVEAEETWWYLPDRRTLRVVTNPNPQGGLTYLFDDVSDRVHLESRYNTLIRVQGETLDTLSEGVALFGSNGRLKLFNHAFQELWKLKPDALESEPHIDAVVGLCRPLAPAEDAWIEIRGAVAGLSDMRLASSCRMERRDGAILDCTAQPLPDGATLLTFIDVTASVNVERALTDKNDALQRAARLRNEFVHHVSYELRSPLTNVIGFTQLLSDETVGPLNPRQREYAGHIMRSSGALLAILNDILDLASIDNDSMELQREEVDIRQTIAAAARGLEDRLVEASLTLEIDAPADIGSFLADAKRVRQILFNLLSNAAGFSSPGQTIRVSARKNDDEVVLEVADQGRGIPQDVMARVFDRFESHTLGTRHRGVGLGLSIVRSFVELHGGRVELVSNPGSGTVVTCIFPTRPSPPQVVAA